MDELLMKIALNSAPNIGPKLIRRLVSYAGGVEGVFREKKKFLEKIPGIGEVKAASFNKDEILKKAEKELKFIRKEGIEVLFYLDKNYPARLRECEDGPVIINVKGAVDFNVPKVISLVGTRNATDYGKGCAEEIVAYLGNRYPDLLVVSGLAYGIDITAHKAALKNNLKTIAVLGHGLSFMYPSMHKNYAKKIGEQGALVSEFLSDQKPEPGNFVSRNRIIAGLADASVVVESAVKGGALITADIANSYNREVFAVPGRSTDTHSAGCNMLIRQNKAALAEQGVDIEEAMGWYLENKKRIPVQKELFTTLNPVEEKIMKYLTENGDMLLDEISISLDIPVAMTSATLLNLEFSGLVKTLPGKCYRRT